jgi:tetratricopeptide (TPR) repeat protein
MRLSLPALGFSYLLLALTAPVAGATPLSVKSKWPSSTRRSSPSSRRSIQSSRRCSRMRIRLANRDTLDTAVEKYDQVRRALPAFSHAARRQCGVEDDLGRHELAIAHCREALKEENSSENLAALSMALLSSRPGEMPAAGDLREAQEMAEAATKAGPDYFHAFVALAKASLATNNFAEFRRSAARLRELGPDEISRPTPSSELSWTRSQARFQRGPSTTSI